MKSALIDTSALAALLDVRAAGRDVAVLDCRFDLAAPDAGLRAFRLRHIATARYVDLNRDLSAAVSAASGRHPLPEPSTLVARLVTLGIGPDTSTIAYDESNGSFAARAWWLLRWLGVRSIAVLDGGMKAWTSEQRAAEAGEPPEVPALTVQRARSAWLTIPPPDARALIATGAELARTLADEKPLLVDARAPERFAGRVEPIDEVAGHVPGAVNHPFSANLGEDGRFLPPAELRMRWLERLGGRASASLVAMCGSGVTACHNLLALELAGLPGARLYSGSWSEWIRDPSRAVERG